MYNYCIRTEYTLLIFKFTRHAHNFIGSQCIENSIQLVGELSQHKGSLMICLGGGWGKVCGLRNYYESAIVVCRQLTVSD